MVTIPTIYSFKSKLRGERKKRESKRGEKEEREREERERSHTAYFSHRDRKREPAQPIFPQ